MHHDYRGGSQRTAIISPRADHEALQRALLPQKEGRFLLYSVAMWHFGYSHLHRCCVCACVCVCMCFLFLSGALEWHFILFAFCSAVNSNVNGLARNPLSDEWEGGRNLGITSGRARAMNWGFFGGQRPRQLFPPLSAGVGLDLPSLGTPLLFSGPQQDTVFLPFFFLRPSVAAPLHCLVQVNE